MISGNLTEGSLEGFRGTGAVIVGSRLAFRLGIAAGDKLRLVSPQSTRTAFGSVPRIKTFRVAAVFEIGMYDYDNNFVYMPLEAGQLYFRTGRGAVTNFEVMVDDLDRVSDFVPVIATVSETPLRVVDWQRMRLQTLRTR